MSYFAVISGKNAKSVSVREGHLVPLSESQPYIANLTDALAERDGTPALLWDDGETGTSNDVICAAEEDLWEERGLESSALWQLLVNCDRSAVSVRVWWANNDPNAFQRVDIATSASEVLALILRQMDGSSGGPRNICFVMHPSSSQA